MLLKKIAFALTLCTALNAAAMDGDVALDLSVLDDLPGSYAVAKQPLFPVVSKTKTVQKHSVKKAKKKVA
ncbi:MAG: hypothetical protein MJ210_04935, partial [Alphaproteobacteria bacterium]|nr:hypothetical protein [Alphaproteobacteria bacterium]